MAEDFQGYEDLVPKGKTIPKADFSGYEDLVPIPGADLLSRAAPVAPPVAQPVSLQGIPTASVVGGAAPPVAAPVARAGPAPPGPSLTDVISGALGSLLSPLVPPRGTVMDRPSPAELSAAEAPAFMQPNRGGRITVGPSPVQPAAPPAGPGPKQPPTIGPLSPTFEPAGGGSVAKELPGTVRRAFSAPGLGLARLVGEVGQELGVPEAGSVAERAAQVLRQQTAEEQMAQQRTAPIVPSFTPNRLERGLAALTEPENVRQAVGQTIQQLPGLVASVMTASPTPAIASMAAIVGAPAYHDYREKGYTIPQAILGAAGQAAAEAGPEGISVKAFLHLPIGKLIRGSPQEFAQATGYLAKTAGIEAGSEELSTFLGWAVDAALRDPSATFADLLKQTGQTAAQIALQAPLMAGAARATRAGAEGVGQLAERLSPGAALGRALGEDVAGADFPSAAAAAAGLTLPQNAQLVQTPAGRAAEPGPYTPGQPVTVQQTEAYRAPQIRIEPQNRESERVGINPQIPQDRIDRNLAPGLGQESPETGGRDQLGSGQEEQAIGALEQRGAPRVTLKPDVSTGPSPFPVPAQQAEERLSRALVRGKDVGAPVLPRRVLRDRQGEIAIGRITGRDWLRRVEQNLSGQEFHDARNWYSQLNQILTPIYGPDAPKVALAWLLSQQRASPSKGMQDVLRASDNVLGKTTLTPGLNAENLRKVLRNEMPAGGVGAKLLDFVDAELGHTTRTVMGRDPRGGSPAPFDIWAVRDTGHVDEPMLNALKERFGASAVRGIAPSPSSMGEAQYERGSLFYNNLASHLNAIGYDGGKWTAREVQSLGWIAMQKAMGETPEYVSDIIGKNVRRVSLGLAPGEGSRLPANHPLFQPENAAKMIDRLAELANVKIIKKQEGAGAYLSKPEGAFQIDAFASPEAVRDFLDMLGYVFQQDMMIAHRALPSGSRGAIDIIFEGAAGRENEFFQTLRDFTAREGKKGSVELTSGFQQINIDGRNGIRILKFTGKFSDQDTAHIMAAAGFAEAETGITLQNVVGFNINLESATNDWTKQKAGQGYTLPLRNRGRLREARELADIVRDAWKPSGGQAAGTATTGRAAEGQSSAQGDHGTLAQAGGGSQEVAQRIGSLTLTTQEREALIDELFKSLTDEEQLFLQEKQLAGEISGSRGMLAAIRELIDKRVAKASGVQIKTGTAKSFGFTARKAINGLRPLNTREIEKLKATIARAGIPPSLAKSVSWLVNDGYSQANGSFHFNGVISLSESRFTHPDFLGTVAHEIFHSFDMALDKRGPDGGDIAQFASHQSGRMTLAKGEPAGDLAMEIVTAAAQNDEIREVFSYPFDYFADGRMSEEVQRVELAAQAANLYFTNPGLTAQFLPKWFEILEGIYGNADKGIPAPHSAQQAHARLQDALQYNDTGVSRQGSFAFEDGEPVGSAAVAQVSARGPPASRVGGDVAGGALQEADVGGGRRGLDAEAGTTAVAAGDAEAYGSVEQRRALSATERAALRAAIARGIAPPPTIPTVPGGPPHGHGAHWDIDEPGLRDRFVRFWQNNKVDLKKVEEAITSFGGVMREDTMAYLYDELNQDRAITRVKTFVQNGVKPLMASIKETGLSLDDVGDYLWAKHAAEANAHLSRINPSGATNLSGMYNNRAAAVAAGEPNALNAQDVMRDLLQPLNPQQRTALTQVERQVQAITKATRQLMVSEGLENQSTINAWEAAYKNYVPLFRDVDATPGAGNSLIVKGPESKRRTGSKREAKAILAAVLSQHAKTIFRAEKAKVGRALVKLAELNPNADFWKVDTPPTKTFFDPNMGIVRTMVDPLYKNQENVFVVKERDATGNVVERSITFNKGNERAVALAHAMRSLDAVQLQGATKWASMVNRFFGNLATQWNPYFWLTNPIRDYRDMVINLQSTPLKGQAARVTAKIPQALAGVASAEFHDGQGTWAKMYREYEDEGGAIGWANVYGDITEEQAHLGTLMKELHQGNMDPRKWGRMSLEMIDKVNRVMESATRVSVYAQAKEHFLQQGLTPELARAKAASLAKNITVNFRRKGNNSAATNAWFLFFNARVQGTATMIKALRDPRVMAVVGVLTAFAAALEILNRLTGDKDPDEDGNNPYDLIPEFVKQTNTILMLPAGAQSTSANEIKNAKGQVVGRYVSIPEPYGYNLFSNVGRMTAQAVMQQAMPDTTTRPKTAGTYATDLLHVALSTFVPFSTAGSAFQTVSPTLLSPVVQRLENKTWYGAPLRPEPLPYEPKGAPNWKLYFRTQSEMSKDLARFLSDTTGGDEVKSGWLDLSPSDLSLIFTTLTGGTGRFGIEMFNFGKHELAVANNEAQPGDLPYRQVPFVGKVFGEATDREAAAKFYELKEQAVEWQRQYKEYRKLGDADKAAAIEEKYPEYLAFAKEIDKKAFKKQNQQISKSFKSLDPAQSMAEREKEKKALMEEHADLIANALTAYNDARRERLGAR